MLKLNILFLIAICLVQLAIYDCKKMKTKLRKHEGEPTEPKEHEDQDEHHDRPPQDHNEGDHQGDKEEPKEGDNIRAIKKSLNKIKHFTEHEERLNHFIENQFRKFDKDHNKSLDKNEFKEVALDSINFFHVQGVDEQHLDQAFEDMDSNQNGTLEIEEVKVFVGTLLKELVKNMEEYLASQGVQQEQH